MKMIFGEDIPAAGMAGVSLGAAGPVTSVRYKMDADGHISFYEVGWREFLKVKRQRLTVDTAVLITIRNNRNNNFQMMVVVDLI